MRSDDTPAQPVQEMALEEAILSTVAYRDVFDFPPTVEEIHRFLHWVDCGLDDVIAALDETALCHGRLATDGHYYCLAGRETILAGRYAREARVGEAMETARAIAGKLAYFPQVRMIAVTGSLAARNCYDGSDLDLLCVTRAGRMWQSRALVLVFQEFDNVTFKRKLCANYFMSTAALEQDTHTMYVAQELAQMVPVYGREVYDKMRADNAWSAQFLPNASGAPDMAEELSVSVNGAIKAPLEALFGTLVGTWFEPFERSRKLRRRNAPDYGGGVHSKSTAERVGHNKVRPRKIEEEWRSRFQASMGKGRPAIEAAAPEVQGAAVGNVRETNTT